MSKDTLSGTRAVRGPAAGVRSSGPGREFGKLWTASSASAIGDGVALTAAPLMASALTTDPRLIAGVTTALTLPYALFGIPAGVLVDRFDRRRSMAVLDFFRGCALLAFTLLVVFRMSSLIALYACFFLVGACETYYRNAAQAIVPAVVPGHLLVVANGRMVAAQKAANSFVGPLLGSAIFLLAPALPFGADSASFFLSAVLLLQLRLAGRQPAGRPADPPAASRRTGLIRDMATGVRWLLGHALLRNLSLGAGLINLVVFGWLAVLVVFTRRVLGLGDFGYGLLLACEAAGALLASGVAAPVVRRAGRDWTLVLVAFALAADGLIVWQAPGPWAVGAALMLGACAGVTWDVVVVALRQTLIPAHLQGRVNSVYRLIAWGSIPVGSTLAGVIAGTWGTRAVYGLGAGVMAVIAAWLAVGAHRNWIGKAGGGISDDRGDRPVGATA